MKKKNQGKTGRGKEAPSVTLEVEESLQQVEDLPEVEPEAVASGDKESTDVELSATSNGFTIAQQPEKDTNGIFEFLLKKAQEREERLREEAFRTAEHFAEWNEAFAEVEDLKILQAGSNSEPWRIPRRQPGT